jgi:eukaryotic-like serine/threonine-protein kinase
MLQAGQLFAGRYRIERLLAQGGMGVIYEAEHLATEERVALKVLWPHVLRSTSAVEKFQLEARIAARIGGEHIVRILDAGYDGARAMPYLAMELLQGQTLQALVSRQGPLTRAEALLALRHVAKALDKAHASVDREGRPAPIVHRDLKPDNLFVALREGGDAVVKVLDFGIAKVATQDQALSQEVRGTPRFMAYEQFTHGLVTPRLDVWALGLIAFYLLTGHNYWLSTGAGNDNGLAPLLSEVLLSPLEPASERAKKYGAAARWPAAFDAWFFQCVNRDIGARFGSAGAAVQAFAEALGGGVELPAADLVVALSTLGAKTASATEPAHPKAEPVASDLGAALPVGATLPLASARPSAPADVMSAPSWPIPSVNEASEAIETAISGATMGSVASSLPLKPAQPSFLPGRRATVGVGLLGVGALLGAVFGGRALLTREVDRPDLTPPPGSARHEAALLPAATSEARPVIIVPISSAAGVETAAPPLARDEPPPPPGEPAKGAAPEGARPKAKGRARDGGARDTKPPEAAKPADTQQYYDDR